MAKIAGFDGWIPIFRGGLQTDSSGVTHDGDALIEKALAKFNTALHEPPVVIGHPADDAPAWGWIEGLKKEGNELLMKCKQIQPEFAAMVERGQFKKRSAAFYPDGTLRHVAFLGAMPPAVKGLPDVSFAEGDAASFEFSEPWAWHNLADVFRRLREWLIEKEGQDTADRIVPDWKIEDMRSAANPPEDAPSTLYKEDTTMSFKEKLAKFFAEFLAKMPDEPASPAAPPPAAFSEADIEAAKTEAAKKEREKVMAEVAETQRQTRLATLKTDIAAFCEDLSKAGKIAPATIKFGLPEILFALAAQDNQIEFGEAGDKTTAFERMKALLASATPLVTFGETATRTKDIAGAGAAGAQLAAKVREKMDADKALSYGAAFAEAQRENPDLAREYAQEIDMR